MTPTTRTRATTGFRDIKGWFNEIDRRCFVALLESQRDTPPGDLVELGVFRGKSAVIIGDYLRDGERFVIVDLFGDEGHFSESDEDAAHRRENLRSYPRLTRQLFEDNYLSCHDELPVVVQGFSSQIVDHVEPGTARFIHIDASHLYPAVKTDCESAKLLLRPGGVVSFDDWRSAKSVGVAAAVWEAVVNGGLIPFAVTRKKLYGCYDDPAPHMATLRAMVAEDPGFFEVDEIDDVLGRPMLRMGPRPRRGQNAQAEDDD
jgi:predicted O-methyltransferase YrrM